MLCGFIMVPRALDAGGGCTISMIVHTDLGGNLPATILNNLSTSSPWRLMQRLRAAFQPAGTGPSKAQVAATTAAAAAAAQQRAEEAEDRAGLTIQEDTGLPTRPVAGALNARALEMAAPAVAVL